jgi:hypothetical protein
MEINVLNEIYNAYKTKLEEATLIWKSECCCISDDEDRDIEDKEDLKYFESLLQKIDNNFHGEKNNAK